MSAYAAPLRRGLPWGFAGYIVAVVAAHALLPPAFTWGIAYLALLGMLFTYPAHALVQCEHRRWEVSLSIGFTAFGLLGVMVSPLFLVAAVAGHGALDLVKYLRGVGARVPVWYLSGCAAFDFAYAGALFTYWSLS